MTLADLLTDDDREALEDLRMNDESPMEIPFPEPVVLQWDDWRIPLTPESDKEEDDTPEAIQSEVPRAHRKRNAR